MNKIILTAEYEIAYNYFIYPDCSLEEALDLERKRAEDDPLGFISLCQDIDYGSISVKIVK